MDCRTHERGVGMLNTPYVKKDTIKNFFPNKPENGFKWITPFADLFTYNQGLKKGTAADDYKAFTTTAAIQLTANQKVYNVLSESPFSPFTTCDHIEGGPFLMNRSTMGQYYKLPDDASKNILKAIGWTVI